MVTGRIVVAEPRRFVPSDLKGTQHLFGWVVAVREQNFLTHSRAFEIDPPNPLLQRLAQGQLLYCTFWIIDELGLRN